MTLMLDTLAQHPYLGFSLFVVGIMGGYLAVLHVLDARSARQMDAAMVAARLKAAANAGTPSTPLTMREQVRRDVERYRTLQGERR